MKDLSIEQIQAKIAHPKSNYKEDVCTDFWEDKEKLIEHMVSVKFKQ